MNLSIATLDKKKYSLKDRWTDFYKNNNHIKCLPYHLTWYVMFEHIFSDPKFEKTNNKLKEIIKNNKYIKIYPLPSYLFSAFVITPAIDLKVVIIGQDPYFKSETIDNRYVPQAMGMSFSVPHGLAIPSSLNNIYDNAIKYGHMKKKPLTGNLWFWASQGCLMLNASLTVEDNSKESHISMWEWFSNYVIRYISDNMTDIVFVLWGAHAYKKINLINIDKHNVIISSHPSGLSAHKPFQNYPAFINEDHFGKINNFLIKKNKQPIMWE